MSFKSKRTGLFKDKKDNKKAQKSTDIIPDVIEYTFIYKVHCYLYSIT